MPNLDIAMAEENLLRGIVIQCDQPTRQPSQFPRRPRFEEDSIRNTKRQRHDENNCSSNCCPSAWNICSGNNSTPPSTDQHKLISFQTLFSTEFFKFKDPVEGEITSSQFWIYWAITIPMTVMAMATLFVATWDIDKEMKSQVSNSSPSEKSSAALNLNAAGKDLDV